MIDFKNSALIKLKHNADYAEHAQKLLIPGERTIGAYSAIRDGVIFTDKRVIAVNVQGVTGKKRSYTSFPYKHIVAFVVETAGHFDLDSELELYIPGVGEVRSEFTGSTHISEIARMIANSSL